MSARLSPLLMLLLAAPTLISPGRSAAQIVGNIGFGLGGKWRSEPSYWNQVRDEGIPEITASLFLGHSALPVVLTGYVARTRQDVRSDTADDARFRQTNYEVGLGLAGIWSLGPLHPYAAAGIARISSKTERTDIDTDAEFTVARSGVWIGAGALVHTLAGFNVGIAGRATNIDDDDGYNLGGLSAGAFIGWGWPASR